MHRVVIDIGKTLAKLTLWNAQGELVNRLTRPNQICNVNGLKVLDAAGIENFIADSLTEFAKLGPVSSIFPVGHGATAVLIRDNALTMPPLDYEHDIPQHIRAAYDALRDTFAETGSPALPLGLNLAAQLYWLKQTQPDAIDGAAILLWPQYWSWRLSGIMASEATSLGCHTDLWRPTAGDFSELAKSLGLAAAFPPQRRAAEALGGLSAEWQERTGLGAETQVHCGIHDSNAALIAARSFPEIGGLESTVLSTGTWFIAMRSPERAEMVDITTLPEGRDCLVNVDAFGTPVPSARFMGGREIETQIEIDTRMVDIKPDQPALLAAVPDVVRLGQMLLPTFAPGTGPFPNAAAQWLGKPDDWYARRAAVCLYAALVADQALDLIGSKERLLIEGRFGEAQVFVRALASLRPDTMIYVANAHNDVAFGALRLIDPTLEPMGKLVRVEPLETSLVEYKRRWRTAITSEKTTALQMCES
jgi:sugar (pentulose or hexulose) kinase